MEVKVEKIAQEAIRLNDKLKVGYTSAKTGEGLDNLITKLEIPL